MHVAWRPPKDTGGVALDSYRFLINENGKVRRSEQLIEKFLSKNLYPPFASGRRQDHVTILPAAQTDTARNAELNACQANDPSLNSNPCQH